jgi:agmatinase
MRGPLYSPGDLHAARELGFELVTDEELGELSPPEYGARVREPVGDSPALVSFDVDVLDPALAPGTGTPGVGGLSPARTLALVRALAGMQCVGFDVVEVSPPYDAPGQTSALVAANVAYELLALRAVASG